MNPKLSNFKNPTEIIYGIGAINELKSIIENQNFKRIMIITDQGIVRAGLINQINERIKDSKSIIFDNVEPNPSVQTCEAAYKQASEFGAEVVIAVGGGSSIDVAKAVCLLATNEGRIVDYEGIDTFVNPILPLIAIPTTAGTASEVTIFTVITDLEREYKLTVGGYKLAPRWAILDPNMTITVPKHITASTGIDALVHAIESFTSTKSFPISAGLAREAIRLISSNLRQATFNGDNVEARDNMLMGSLLAGLAFNNTRLGACHAMSHPISAMFQVPHGIANSILIPHVMEFNALANPDKFAIIAEDMGESLVGLTTLQKAWKAVDAIRTLTKDLGIPQKLSEFNVHEDMIEKMAADAMKSGNIQVNPRKTTIDDLISLYNKSM